MRVPCVFMHDAVWSAHRRQTAAKILLSVLDDTRQVMVKNNKWHVNSKTIRPSRDSNVWGQSHWVNSAFPSLCFQYSQNDLKRQKAHQPAEDELINKGDLKVLFMAIINSFC